MKHTIAEAINFIEINLNTNVFVQMEKTENRILEKSQTNIMIKESEGKLKASWFISSMKF